MILLLFVRLLLLIFLFWISSKTKISLPTTKYLSEWEVFKVQANKFFSTCYRENCWDFLWILLFVQLLFDPDIYETIFCHAFLFSFAPYIRSSLLWLNIRCFVAYNSSNKQRKKKYSTLLSVQTEQLFRLFYNGFYAKWQIEWKLITTATNRNAFHAKQSRTTHNNNEKFPQNNNDTDDNGKQKRKNRNFMTFVTDSWRDIMNKSTELK